MTKKIVGVDLRCLPADGSDGAGVAHAVRNLCEHLSSLIARPTSHVGLRFYVPKGAKWDLGEIISLPDATGRSLRNALMDKTCDLLFVPGGSIAPALNVPVIPWVHDLIIFEHPEFFNQPWLQRQITTHLFKKGLKRSLAILAVSEYTKSQIVKLLKIDSGKIMVTYEGGDSKLGELRTTNYEQRRAEAKQFCERELGLAGDFVLCLGTVEPRKNIAMLMRAWKSAKRKSAQAPDLVVAGSNGWKYEDVEQEIKSLTAIESQFFHRYKSITEDQKRTLLLGASMVMVPSLDEGFGLVALEAMQAGTPVVVSKVGALPEVVGEAGMVIDPKDEDSWASAFLTCVTDNRACKLRSEMGFKQAEKFSWEKSAEVVYQTLNTSLSAKS